ncbi:hypothetical protein ACHAWF_003956 [Thalassiosira exigua]
MTLWDDRALPRKSNFLLLNRCYATGYYQMGESTDREAVSELSRGIINSPEIRDVYVRDMTKSDARRVVALHKEMHDIDGMFGSLDVTKVQRENCPTAWKGQFEGKEGEPTIALEAVADYNLWIWHDAFGFPGGLKRSQYTGEELSK